MMNMSKKNKMIGLLVCAVLLIASIVGGTMVTAATSATTVTSRSVTIGEDKAKTIALEHAGVPESEVSYLRCELDFDNRTLEYDVEFWVGNIEYDYELNARTGAVLSYDWDAEYEYTPPVGTVGESYIGEEAAKAALAHIGVTENDVSYLRVKPDLDNGTMAYDVEFWVGNVEYDYEIDARSGEILSYDMDTDYEDAPPASADDQSYIGEEAAKAAALAHAGVTESDVSNLRAKLDYENRVVEYEVEFLLGTTEYEYEIDAITGDLRSYDYDMEDAVIPPTPPVDSAPDAIAPTTQYITEEEAKAIAFADAGVTAEEVERVKCEFDYDDGRAEYEVEWEIGRMEYEYTIGAVDGSIWERDIDSDD